MTLGQIESGLYEEEIDDEIIEGNYAEEGYPDFALRGRVGDETCRERVRRRHVFDNWQRGGRAGGGRGRGGAEQPYEKVQIKRPVPQIQELKNELVLERWVPWDQVCTRPTTTTARRRGRPK